MLRFNKSLSAVNSEAAWLHLKFNLPLVGEGGGGGGRFTESWKAIILSYRIEQQWITL